ARPMSAARTGWSSNHWWTAPPGSVSARAARAMEPAAESCAVAWRMALICTMVPSILHVGGCVPPLQDKRSRPRPEAGSRRRILGADVVHAEARVHGHRRGRFGYHAAPAAARGTGSTGIAWTRPGRPPHARRT